MELTFLRLTAAAYAVAAAIFIVRIWRAEEPRARWGLRVLALGFVTHTAAIFVHFFDVGMLPVTRFHEGSSFFAWLIVGLYFVVTRTSQLGVLGAITGPLAAVFTLVAVVSYEEAEAVPVDLLSPWLPIHVTFAFLGNAVFAVAFAASIVYLVQERQLKHHRTSWVIRKLPSLEQLDRVNFRCLMWGFPLLTLGIVTGGIWASQHWGMFWSGEAREILSVLTWLIYAGLLQFRIAAGLRGRRAARLTILGFAVVIVSYFSIPLLDLPGRHGGGYGS